MEACGAEAGRHLQARYRDASHAQSCWDASSAPRMARDEGGQTRNGALHHALLGAPRPWSPPTMIHQIGLCLGPSIVGARRRAVYLGPQVTSYSPFVWGL